MKKKGDQDKPTEPAESTRQREESATALVSRFETERKQFRALVLANPNYFGNLKVSPFNYVIKHLSCSYDDYLS